MIDTFDSRALRRPDCYGQRFMRTGTFGYDVVNAAWAPVTTQYPYKINVVSVEDRASAMEQHTVTVRSDGRRFRPESETLEVAEGDLVVWHCPDASTTPFAVVGEKEFFGNIALVNECGFSHAFAAAGEYQWGDALGSDLRGVVRVTDPAGGSAEDFRKWQRQLTKGTLVMISGGKVDPIEVAIVTGQTVYFAVVNGKGISVTDVRLIGTDPRETEPKAAPKKAGKPAKKAGRKSGKKR